MDDQHVNNQTTIEKVIKAMKRVHYSAGRLQRREKIFSNLETESPSETSSSRWHLNGLCKEEFRFRRADAMENDDNS